tara:strand:- start:64 stop:282 length:219 start_codon:yes stop_codon:yes gene_type:complete
VWKGYIIRVNTNSGDKMKVGDLVEFDKKRMRMGVGIVCSLSNGGKHAKVHWFCMGEVTWVVESYLRPVKKCP